MYIDIDHHWPICKWMRRDEVGKFQFWPVKLSKQIGWMRMGYCEDTVEKQVEQSRKHYETWFEHALVGDDIEILWKLPSAIVYKLAPLNVQGPEALISMSWTTHLRDTRRSRKLWGRPKERNLQKARLAEKKSCLKIAPIASLTPKIPRDSECCLSRKHVQIAIATVLKYYADLDSRFPGTLVTIIHILGFWSLNDYEFK